MATRHFTAMLLIYALALSTPARVYAGDYNSVCGDLSGEKAQRQSYCDAAKSAEEGSRNDSILMGVWAAVTAACTVACFNITQTTAYVCTGVSLAGGATDAIVTKNFAGFLSSLPGTLIANKDLLFGGSKEPPKAEGDAAGKGDTAKKSNPDRTGSCISAATAAIQVISKTMDKKTQDKAAKSNLETAEKLKSTAIAQSGAGFNTEGGSGGSNGGGSTGSGSQASKSVSSASDAGASDPCAAAQSTGSAEAHISCAIAQDPNIPGFVRSPKFAQEIKEKTGKNLADFLNTKSDNPTELLGSAMAGGLNSEQAGKLASALNELQKNMPEISTGSYAGGGGGGLSLPSGGSEDIGQLMAGLMDQFKPKSADEAPPGFSAVDFASLNRAPAQVVQDKSISIFNRISFRYYYVGKRMIGGGRK